MKMTVVEGKFKNKSALKSAFVLCYLFYYPHPLHSNLWSSDVRL